MTSKTRPRRPSAPRRPPAGRRPSAAGRPPAGRRSPAAGRPPAGRRSPAAGRLQARRRRRNLGAWLAFTTPILAVGLLIGVAALWDRPSGEEVAGQPAPPFTLPDTTGATVSLEDVTADGPALLYFSMGVGCDGCFTQIPEIIDEVSARGITLVPVMTDPAEWLNQEAHRLGVDTPILVDAGARVSAAYGMIGQYGHADRPSHSFALVDGGTITWTRHYAEMFVPASRFLADLPA
jgi:peroxiredoxin